MTKLMLFYDMDNTIAEMHKKLTGRYSGHIKQYDPQDEIEEQQILNALNTEGFFTDLAVINNANRVLKQLVLKGYEVYILSQPMPRPTSIDEKNYWLDKFFPFIPRYKRIYTFDKWLLAGENRILIDDNTENLLQWTQHRGTAICFIRGYNKNYKGRSIKQHKEIFQILEKLEKDSRT